MSRKQIISLFSFIVVFASAGGVHLVHATVISQISSVPPSGSGAGPEIFFTPSAPVSATDLYLQIYLDTVGSNPDTGW